MTPSFYDFPDTFPDRQLLTADGVLTKGQMRYFNPKSDHILNRFDGLEGYLRRRLEAGVFSHRMQVVGDPGTRATVRDLAGREFTGINLSTVDYMGLSDHPKIKNAARRTLDTSRLHSVNTGPLLGNSPESGALETWMARHMGHEFGMLFPTGWAASFSGVAALARPGDHVLIDEYAHQSLKQGANAACDSVIKFRHLDNSEVANRLVALRKADPDAGVLVVTEGLYSMDGDAPDIRELLQICKDHRAALLVDICHDLGCTGPRGTGTLGLQGILGDPDLIVVGAFSKAFATNGGFLTTSNLGVIFAAYCFAGPYTYSTSLSPMQISIAQTGLEIAAGPEGAARRAKLEANIAATRGRAAEHGILAYGAPSPIVSLHVGSEKIARLACARAFRNGLVTTILEYPVVSRGKARFRLSMSPEHDEAVLIAAVDIIAESIDWARAYQAEIDAGADALSLEPAE
ncbi:aminotransferase class I/II-fold pyridoxal phosphate-dependent enzyme [Marivita sp. GX14005]|uniref:aminotransferase class I/II-fold pyridoxal phosphate-dependent enzyme n=1 Tax=Marivita sp. GX14005 TaxID=2942276 RepID=UPI002018C4DC|nr:aminotransferase class I/II-fold pyridoxal phosphate-dependent enzyme [Marivita sp. GX14005]MCL3883038.1 aminotransferase class I/II-fold pyridoxal phosphate-dependent enzyme [Marivita sp. GX14005]